MSRISKHDTQRDLDECDDILRFVENYREDLKNRSNEILSETKWDKITGYHCIKNPSVYAMHDLYLGANQID